MPYEYEVEGYVWSDTKYLPDFYLPTQDGIIETKGSYPDQDAIEKGIMLSEDTWKEVFLFYGQIPNPLDPAGIRGNPN